MKSSGEAAGRSSWRWLGWAGLFGALWLSVIHLLGPFLIGRAYAGESLPFLNAILAGRDQHNVEFYLDAWRHGAWLASGVLLVIGVVVVGMVRISYRGRSLLQWALGGEPELRPKSALGLCLLFATAAGLGEAVYLGVRQLVTDRPAAGFYPELLWAAPLSAVLVALVLGGPLLLWAQVGRVGIGAGKLVFVLGLGLAYSVLQSEGVPLHWWANVALSAGTGAALSRLAVERVVHVRRLAGRATMILTAFWMVGFAWGVWVSPGAVEARSRTFGRVEAGPGLPNILLIILDTVRAQNLGLYGYERNTTPTIETLADSGTVFERAIATAPWTLPSHATMFTGRYNFELNVGSWKSLDDRHETLAEVFRGRGYSTAAFVANRFYTTRMSGLQRGFDRYEEIPVDVGRVIHASWLGRVVLAPVYRLVDDTPPDIKLSSEVTDEFRQWYDQVREGPFFVFLNLFDAHSPYQPPMPYAEAFGERPAESWFDFQHRWRQGEWTEEGRRGWVNMYDGAIHYMDHQIGEVLDHLRAERELENTIVVVTSDHGEMWGEQGLFGHDNTVYDPVLWVPLIVYAPGRVPSGIRIPGGVTLRDLGASLIKLAGLEGETGFPGAPWPWDDLGHSSTTSPLLARVSPDPRNNYSGPYRRGELKSLHQDGWHYIAEDSGVEELYDLSEDPGESRDLADHPEYELEMRRFRQLRDSIWGGRWP